MTDATIRDVAKRAGVGVGTVSRVLNDNPSVSEATRQKVLAAIEDLNFMPNVSARRLSSGRTMALGVVVPFFTNASVVKRLQGVVSVLANSEYDLVLFDVETVENRKSILRNIASRKMVDGLLIVSLKPTESDMEQFLQSELPAVMVDAQHPALSCIVVDNVAGAAAATRHLIELGHVRIGYISDLPRNPFNFSPTADRLAGYKHALAEAGIPYRDAYYRDGELDTAVARELAHELLTLDDPPTAVFAYSDTQAIGVLQAAEDLSLRVPEELSVVGYDNIEIARLLNLTTIRQSLFESGVEGARLLLDVVQGHQTEIKTVLLPTELVVRHTTAPCMPVSA